MLSETGTTLPTATPPPRATHTINISRYHKLTVGKNLGTNGLKVASEPGRRTACKDRIAQRSPIQAAATLDVA
ncbi:hypothetical protein J6590_021650 [Homalodisca vitripennis]|nr:hypothetical protein J6590_021650 [Homalodisca vitripennis]